MKRSPLLVLLLVVVLGVGAWLLLRPKPVPPPVLLHPTARQVAETQKHLDTLGKAAAKPGTSPRTLRLSENDINVALAASPTVKKLLAAHGVKAVQIVLQEPDGVVVHASATVEGRTRNIQISGAMVPDPKLGVRFTASSAQVGSLPLPAALVTAETDKLAAHFARQFLSRTSLSVQGVYVQKKRPCYCRPSCRACFCCPGVIDNQRYRPIVDNLHTSCPPQTRRSALGMPRCLHRL